MLFLIYILFYIVFNDPLVSVYSVHVALLQSPLPVFVGERCAVFPSSSYADLFMNLGIYCFEVKPGDAVEK